MLKNKQLKFTPEMSRKAEAGEKTQTRRPIKFPKGSILEEISLPWLRPTILMLDTRESVLMDCPYGKPGDRFEWDGQEYEITSVRAEMVQDISEKDAQAEGMQRPILYDPSKDIGMPAHPMIGQYKDSFKAYWDFLYAAKGFGWNLNPWVWVIKFRRIANA